MQLLSEHAVRNQEVGYSNPLALLHIRVNNLEAQFLRLGVSKIDYVPFLPFSCTRAAGSGKEQYRRTRASLFCFGDPFASRFACSRPFQGGHKRCN
jgi:hypothetical protein